VTSLKFCDPTYLNLSTTPAPRLTRSVRRASDFVQQALTLKFRFLSIQVPSEMYESSRKMSAMGIFQQLTSKASCKSLSLIDLRYLPAKKLRIARMTASTLQLIASSARSDKKFLPSPVVFCQPFPIS
jgi:hypothetical protein